MQCDLTRSAQRRAQFHSLGIFFLGISCGALLVMAASAVIHWAAGGGLCVLERRGDRVAQLKEAR